MNPPNPRILMLETIEPSAEALLASRYQLVHLSDPNDPSPAMDQGPFTALITRGKGQVDRNLLRQLVGLKIAARCGVGLDNFDLAACEENHIEVLNVPDATTIAVAEQALFFMLAMVRDLPRVSEAVRNHQWQIRNQYQGNDLYGLKLGLIGFGAIASRLANLAAAIGLDVRYWNHRPKPSSYQQMELDELLATSDIVSLHIPLTQETRHFIGERELECMRPGGFLINTARGAHVDHQAVERALVSGRLAGYAADGFDTDAGDPNSHPLCQHPNVIITPHCAALTTRTYQDMSMRIARSVMRSIEAIDADSQ